jgi:general secretion pathway protein B
MSLILDALKRAERERRLERPPDLTAVYEENHRPQQGLRPWLWVTGVFLVGAVVIGLVLWPEGKGPVRSPVLEESSTTRSASLTAPTGNAEIPSSSASSDSTTLKPAETPPAQTPLPQPVPAPVQESQPARASKMATKTADDPPPETGSKPDPESPDQRSQTPGGGVSAAPAAPVLPSRETMPVQPPAPAVSSAPEEAPVEPRLPQPANGNEPVAETVIVESAEPLPPQAGPTATASLGKHASAPLISELPYEVREKLGKLQINVHSYSDNPVERLVFINMRSFKVGDRIGENGPILKEITPDGVIIDYGEGQTRVPVWK